MRTPIIYSASALFLFLTLVSALPASSPPAPSTRPAATQPASVLTFDKNTDAVVKISRGGGYLLATDVKINNRDVGAFIIDTGANHSVIDLRVASDLGLTLATPTTAQVPYYNVGSISLGGMTVSNHLLPAMDLRGFAGNFRVKVVGLIGGDLFGKAPFTLDCAAGTLTFHNLKSFAPPKGIDAQTFTLGGRPSGKSDHAIANPFTGIPVVKGKIDGVEARILLDTGATMPLALNAEFTAQHKNLVDWDRPKPATMSLSSPGDPYSAKVASLSILDRDFKGQDLRQSMAFVASAARPVGAFAPSVDATVGSPILEQFRLTFDYSTARLWPLWQSPQSVEQRLKAGLDPNAKDLSNHTPLMEAASRGDIAGCQALIKAGADPKAQEVSGRSVLLCAVLGGNADAVNLILKSAGKEIATANPADVPLLLTAAIDSGNPDVLAAILDAGVSANSRDRMGQSPLHQAAQRGDDRTVAILIKHNADVNATTLMQVTPLTLAVQSGSVKTVKALLDGGATPKPDPFGLTILHIAAKSGHADVVRCLLTDLPKHGIKLDANAPNPQNVTPLMLACQYGDADTVAAFLDAGGDLKSQAQSKAGPLYFAVVGGRPDVVALLINRGAPLEARTAQGITPLAGAASLGKDAVAQVLLKAGADPNAKTDDGKTPLDLARRNGHQDIVKLLEPATTRPATRPQESP